MKAILIFVFALFAVVTTNAQAFHIEGPDHTTFAVDTVSNSTGVTFTSTYVMRDLGVLEAYVVADSLSGSTTGVINYEYAYDTSSPLSQISLAINS